MDPIDRRQLLNGVLASAASAALTRATTASAAVPINRPWKVIDTNVSLFQWPFRRLPFDTPGELVNKLTALNISQAWTGSFEALLHRDVAGVNLRLARACREFGNDVLTPVGCVNPTLPDWADDVRRCHEEHGMPGIRLHPNYHVYTLDDPRFEQLLSLATEHKLFVQLATAMEDTRTQHPQVQVADVNLAPLPSVLKRVPDVRLQIINYRPQPAVIAQLTPFKQVCFDTARVDSTDGIARLIRSVSPERVLFGTHTPFLIQEAALIRTYESQLDDREYTMLFETNAERFASISPA